MKRIIRINDEELRNFFPLPKVVTGIFKLIQNLFDVTIEEVKKGADDKQSGQLEVWHESVKMFRLVENEGNKELGHFYFDPYIR